MLTILVSSALAVPLSSLSEGDLIVSEIMHTPAAALWYRGEWFEITNNAGDSVDLDGLVVSDSGGEAFSVSGSLTIADGEHAVFALRSTPTANGGLPAVDYVYSRGDFALQSAADEITLSYGGVTFDTAAWDSGSPDADGRSLSRDPSDGEWCAAWSVYGDGDAGTPGADNDSCDFSLDALGVGDLLISEVMASPSAADYNKGEWVEVYNNTDAYVDLDGLVVSDSGSDVFVISGSVPLAPGGHAVLAARDNYLYNGGITDVAWRYYYGTEMRLLNTDDVSLSYGAVTFDEVSWDSSYPASLGVSMQLDVDQPDASLNDSPDAWCAGETTFGDGDYGTPAATNADCLSDLDLDGYDDDTDCDDGDPAVYPGAEEVCDGVDNNCDGEADEDTATDAATWYTDDDDDGYGDPDSPVVACDRPTKHRTNALDCDDTDETISPAATDDSCDGIDNDCDGADAGCSTGYAWDFSGTDAVLMHSTTDTYDEYIVIGDVSPQADLDGDGIDDLLFGYQHNTDDGSTRTAAVLYGPVSGDLDTTAVDASIGFDGSTYTNADQYPSIVASPGDIDGDGYDDILSDNKVIDPTGSYRNDQQAGSHVFYGPITGSLDILDADDTVTGSSDGVFSYQDRNDGAFLFVHDYQDDEYALLHFEDGEQVAEVSIPASGSFFVSEGEVYGGYLGDLDGDGGQEAWARNESDSWVFFSPLPADGDEDDADIAATTSYGAAGDINGDGYDDVYFKDDYTHYFAYGPLTSLGAFDEESADAEVGDSVRDVIHLVGDVDDDGVDDLLYEDRPYIPDAGTGYLLAGPLSGAVSLDDALESQDLPYYLIFVGDVSGDGLPDATSAHSSGWTASAYYTDLGLTFGTAR